MEDADRMQGGGRLGFEFGGRRSLKVGVGRPGICRVEGSSLGRFLVEDPTLPLTEMPGQAGCSWAGLQSTPPLLAHALWDGPCTE